MSFLISEFTVINDKKTDETYTKTSCYCHRRLHCCTLLSAAATEPRATMLTPKTKETQSKLIWKSYKYQQDLTRDFVHQVRLINSWTKTKYDKATLVAWSWLRWLYQVVGLAETRRSLLLVSFPNGQKCLWRNGCWKLKTLVQKALLPDIRRLSSEQSEAWAAWVQGMHPTSISQSHRRLHLQTILMTLTV